MFHPALSKNNFFSNERTYITLMINGMGPLECEFPGYMTDLTHHVIDTTTKIFLQRQAKSLYRGGFCNRLGSKVTISRDLYRGGCAARLGNELKKTKKTRSPPESPFLSPSASPFPALLPATSAPPPLCAPRDARSGATPPPTPDPHKAATVRGRTAMRVEKAGPPTSSPDLSPSRLDL